MTDPVGHSTGLKHAALDELRESGKMANVTAESFVQQHAGIKVTVQAHDQDITHLKAGMKELENQVKAIARVMASQNVQKLTENIKLSQDELQRNLQQYVNDKNKDLMHHVEREVAEVIDTKSGLGKRIDAVEQHIMTVLQTKMEEAAQNRFAIREELEKIRDSIEEVPGSADKNNKLLKQLETKVNEIKCEFRNMERDHETANIEQDRQVANISAEIRNALDAGRDKLAEESKVLTRSIRKHEILMEDRLKSISDSIERETAERIEMCKGFPNMVVRRVNDVKHELETKVSAVELEIDRKVRPAFTHIAETKRIIEEEKVHRETADQELSTRIAKEAKERSHDQEKLVGLIATCQSALSRMHKM